MGVGATVATRGSGRLNASVVAWSSSRSVAVATGFYDVSALRACGAAYVFETLADTAAVLDAIAEGSVQRSGNHVAISVQLIDGSTDRQLWATTFERELSDVLVLEREVARAIAAEIKVTVAPEEAARLAQAPQVNPAAHEAYLKGRYHWLADTPEDRRKAKEYFEEATRIEPNYAPAYAGLADYYWASPELETRSAMLLAKQNVLKALELDPELAAAHTALAAIRFSADWDWAAADKEFKRAIQLNPNDAEAHRMYSVYSSALGRADQALSEISRSQQLDPLSASILTTAGWVSYFARQYQPGIDRCRRAWELDPNSVRAGECLGAAYMAEGAYDQAIAACQRAVALSGGDPIQQVTLGRAYALAGRNSEARSILRKLRRRSQSTYVPPYYVATLYVALGDKEQALTLLKQAYREREGYLPWAKVDVALDPLRSDPRFQALLQRVGLPQ